MSLKTLLTKVKQNNYLFPLCVWLTFFVLLFFCAKKIDIIIFPFIQNQLSVPFIDNLTFFLTEIFTYIIFALGLIVILILLQKKHLKYFSVIMIFVSALVAVLINLVLKKIFAVDRPYISLNLIPLVEASLESFPSNHTVFVFSILPPLYKISRKIGFLWAFFALSISLSRIYQFVHYPTDIVAGMFVGILIGLFISSQIVSTFIYLAWKKLEFRRQIFHLLLGIFFVLLHRFGFLTVNLLLIVLLLGFALSKLSLYFSLPLLKSILRTFDRARDKSFPGRGAFYYTLGATLSFILFPVHIAYSAILILAIIDSFNYIFREKLGSLYALPWNKSRTIFDVLLGIIVTSLIIQFFVGFPAAISVCSIVGFIETFPIKINKFYINDNLFIPLLAGIILQLI